jgi:NADPH-dependent curcumin reductase CurA
MPATAVFMVLRWVCMQPLASPVVPEVYGRMAKSSGPAVKGVGDKLLASASRHSVTPGRDRSTRGAATNSGTETPNGVHVNFENVGGDIMKAVLARMVLFGRVGLCGLISGYSGDAKPSDDFSVIVRRLTVLSGWIREGKLKAEETVVDGLEEAPLVLNRLFDGSHRGKLVLRVDGSDGPIAR